jgi:surface carbohydrate biosynthesis protein
MARRIVYLLIEEADRELKSRALIAALAVERGFDVVLVPQWMAWQNWTALPPGLVLFKGNNTAQAVRMSEARRHGHVVASIEEEVLGISDKRQLLRCYDDGVERACDVFLANGDFQAQALAEAFPSAQSRIHVTGNPRMDLLGESFLSELRAQAAAVRGRYGDFILINTNFSTINPRGDDALGCFDVCERVGLIDSGNPVDMADFFTWCSWEQTNLAAIGALVHEARERAPWPLVVRPHPTEDLDKWTQALDGLDGVAVIREGDHLAWTAAARVLVHPGCTTGVEALLLGTPAISLIVDDNPWHDLYLSNLVNPNVGEAGEAVDMILDLAAGGDRLSRALPDCFDRLRGHVLTGPDHLASRSVVDILEATPSPGVATAEMDRLGALRQVASTEGKIDPVTFASGPVSRMISSFRATLGLNGDVLVREPSAGLLHCPPIDNRGRQG